jgi:phosphoribosyl 1,2-cyclic phosphodiesterase
VRYGGNTSCVALSHGGEGELPSLVIDAGTGIRHLHGVLGEQPFSGALLFGHLHWDHTQGLPFARPLDREGSSVEVFVPAQEGDGPVEVLSRAMSPPHFPILPTELRGDWTFSSLEDGRHSIAGFDVLALDIPHKGGRTFGYRITSPVSGASIAYLSDHWPISLGPGPDGLGEYHPTVLELCTGVDLVLHDAQYTAEELPARADFGHSAIEYAVELGPRCASPVLLFHHDPSRTDDALDALVATHGTSAAAEGMVLSLP